MFLELIETNASKQNSPINSPKNTSGFTFTDVKVQFLFAGTLTMVLIDFFLIAFLFGISNGL